MAAHSAGFRRNHNDRHGMRKVHWGANAFFAKLHDVHGRFMGDFTGEEVPLRVPRYVKGYGRESPSPQTGASRQRKWYF
ncbi:MAG: hypothetical protein L6R28_08140 [Planctomycetes bacterium]|nr:hypothetical protein [Planctomycetota bacterium]